MVSILRLEYRLDSLSIGLDSRPLISATSIGRQSISERGTDGTHKSLKSAIFGSILVCSMSYLKEETLGYPTFSIVGVDCDDESALMEVLCYYVGIFLALLN